MAIDQQDNESYFTQLPTQHMFGPCKGIEIPDSVNFLLVESGTRGSFACGTRDTAQGMRNPTKDQNPESTAWNPESQTILDFLTWGDMSIVFSRVNL